jgi:hypothetical protein
LWTDRQRIQWAGGCAEVWGGKVQIDRRFLQVTMTKQYLDRAEVSAGFQ